jgi:transcriptional regulator with XRE-family HTH domain
MTQEQLAEALDTGTRNVQLLESGANLTLYRLARVAAALGVRPDELLAPETHQPPPRRYGREAPPVQARALSERPGRARTKR